MYVNMKRHFSWECSLNFSSHHLPSTAQPFWVIKVSANPPFLVSPLGPYPNLGQGPTKNLKICDQVFSEEGIPALYRGISMERVLGLGMGGSGWSYQSFLLKPVQPSHPDIIA